MKIFSTFLSIAFIAFILISPVITKQFIHAHDVNNADKEETFLRITSKCVIDNAITSYILKSKFLPHTLFCITVDIFTYEEGESFFSEVVKGIIYSMSLELIVHKWLGINLGAVREIIKKAARIIRRILLL
ncbi:hypothetical protein GLOIN_2v1640457 [Rhizophagus clarus]|uniref:Uncharacterized protein n=1 Tax=Rhizophagus clarus TaxID=94130 RepID=A0A8H3QPA4_9GLOM|nr:hypothetical protein GLOIN_2v1640457 [Rhizophagus clarus]